MAGWQGGNQQGPWGSPPGGGGPQRPGGGGGMPPGPDIDALLRKLQESLGNFTPGQGKHGGKGIVLTLLIIGLLWLSSGVYIVKPDEQGVVMRFGKYHRTTQSGLNFHLPYPIESALTPRVTVVNRVEVGYRSGLARSGKHSDASVPEESLMLTGDENIVDINFEVQWKINNASDFLFNVRNPEATVKAVAESAMREAIGKSEIATVLTTGRENVALATQKLMQDTLDSYKAGIQLVSVNLRDANPPAQVVDAFLDVQSARVDMETARNQAEAYRNDILPRARGEAEKLVLDAEAYKQEVVARSRGEASRFSAVYNEYKQAKDVTKKRMYLETMEDIMRGMTKVIMDSKASNGVVPYMPLPELKAKAAQQEHKP
ncbi:MAG: FtsH protease activity modulator HflK [Rickettsiales bacterium]|nr:FtsH protease activity modulator HflK [Rickettsiales bacterium]